MASPRDLRSGHKSDRLVRVNDLVGYMIPPDRSVEDVLSAYDELLRSEGGIDSTWRGFEKSEPTAS